MKFLQTAVAAILLSACQSTPVVVAPAPVQPFPTIAPEVNNASEVPDCVTAGERIAKYVEVGMPKTEVRRLVGKPIRDQGSSWGWAKGGYSYPGIFFSNDVVNTFGADTSICD